MTEVRNFKQIINENQVAFIILADDPFDVQVLKTKIIAFIDSFKSKINELELSGMQPLNIAEYDGNAMLIEKV